MMMDPASGKWALDFEQFDELVKVDHTSRESPEPGSSSPAVVESVCM